MLRCGVDERAQIAGKFQNGLPGFFGVQSVHRAAFSVYFRDPHMPESFILFCSVARLIPKDFARFTAAIRQSLIALGSRLL